MLRRLKKDVLKELPDKTEEAVSVELTGEQRRLYEAHEERLRLFLEEAGRERQERLERSVEDIRRRFGKAAIGRAVTRLHGDLWSPDLEKTQVIHPVGLLKGSIS